ncbi:MAG: archaellin/type IV pilin N-terminal domain-containing protein [Methanomassiliicoccales archaeon]
MKKMWKLNNKAVSPVIATILMVAITVVLAAVLYVMVMGFGGGDDDQAPSGVLGNVEADLSEAGTYNITIISISPETDIVDLRYKVGPTGTLEEFVVDTDFFDLGDDNAASAGDYFVVTGAANGVVIYLIHEPTGDVIDSIEI